MFDVIEALRIGLGDKCDNEELGDACFTDGSDVQVASCSEDGEYATGLEAFVTCNNVKPSWVTADLGRIMEESNSRLVGASLGLRAL